MEVFKYMANNMCYKAQKAGSLKILERANNYCDTAEDKNEECKKEFNIDELKLFQILYADDAVVFRTSPTALQSILNDLYNYCNTWGLKINVNKTKTMIFERGRSTNHNFTLNNIKLENVSSFKYLGVHFSKMGLGIEHKKC